MSGRGSTFDFAAFKRAFEGKDFESRVSFYADDAERIESRQFSPRSPNRMVGSQQISEFLRRICPADFGISIVDEVVGEDRFALRIDCAFPDGKHIFENIIIHTGNGKVVRQVIVEAWDG